METFPLILFIDSSDITARQQIHTMILKANRTDGSRSHISAIRHIADKTMQGNIYITQNVVRAIVPL